MVARLRMESVRQALAAHGVEEVASARGTFLYDSATDAVASILERASPTAIIAANDMMAMGVMDALRDAHGLSVPGDISVTGFDGIGAARFSAYDLTTIRQPVRRMAEAAVALLMEARGNPRHLG